MQADLIVGGIGNQELESFEAAVACPMVSNNLYDQCEVPATRRTIASPNMGAALSDSLRCIFSLGTFKTR